jgi:hypothetical protein
MIKRELRNPQGLNEILSEILGHRVTGDWDKSIPSQVYLGKLKKEQYKGRTSQIWGNLLEKYAFLYLAKELEESGWKLYRGEKIGGMEYDCLGWKGELKNKRSSDLAIELYFPIPKNEQSYEFEYIQKKTDKMVRRLEKINAKQKYILLGVPRDRTITVVERPRPDIRVVYQEYRFTKTEPKKRKVLSHE